MYKRTNEGKPIGLQFIPDHSTSNRNLFNAIKKKRDHAQALAVCKLVLQYLPDLRFKPEELRMFPKAVVDQAVRTVGDAQMPTGFDTK